VLRKGVARVTLYAIEINAMLDFLRRRTRSEHERIAAVLSAYVDGELAAEDQQRVEAHLAQCDACAEELRTLQYTKVLLAEAPTPPIPRSFVVRRADVEAPADTAPRRLFGLSTRLAYGYLKGATALVTMAFALVVAGDLIAQLGFGGAMLAPAPAEQAVVVEEVVEKEVEKVVEKEVVVQVTEEMQERYEETPTLVVEGTPEMEVQVEKVVVPTPVPLPAERSAAPTASPPVLEKEEIVQAPAAPEAGTTQDTAVEALPLPEATAVEETYDVGEISTPSPMPTATPPPSPLPSPTQTRTPSVTPERAVTTAVTERGGYGRPGILRIAEIGLGTTALILLVATLVARRQQSQ
jgi:hypothetical protein